MSNEVSSALPERSSSPAKDYHEPPPAPFIGAAELKKWALYRALIAEFVATLLLLYIGISTITGHKSERAKNDDPCSGVGLLGIAWAFGGMVFILVYCTAGISGGHINPAVTFGLFLSRKISLTRGLLYIIVQYLGAICGAALVKAIYTSKYELYGGGVNSVTPGYTKGVAWSAEMIGTFVLVYTILSTTDSKRNARDLHVPVLALYQLDLLCFWSTWPQSQLLAQGSTLLEVLELLSSTINK